MTLPGHLKQQMARLHQLLELLRKERSALLESRVDGSLLSQLAEDKRGQLEELEKLERLRRHALRSLGYSDDRTGDELAASDTGCLPLWREICTCASEVAELNRGNGALIKIRMEHNRSLLDFLQTAASRNLYGPDGRAQTRSRRINSRA